MLLKKPVAEMTDQEIENMRHLYNETVFALFWGDNHTDGTNYTPDVDLSFEDFKALLIDMEQNPEKYKPAPQIDDEDDHVCTCGGDGYFCDCDLEDDLDGEDDPHQIFISIPQDTTPEEFEKIISDVRDAFYGKGLPLL